MKQYLAHLEWIDAQQPAMLQRLWDLASINTGSFNVTGISRAMSLVQRWFEELGARVSLIPLPAYLTVADDGQAISQALAPALHASIRAEAPLRILLGIHLDTVYEADNPFQTVIRERQDLLRGPGVADAKGGLVVLLAAVAALERSPWAAQVGWQVLINTDEELGSPGSSDLWADAAKGCALGLLFEPALPDGALVSARKGSGNFTARVTGRAAHVGRNPQAGRNAIHTLAEVVLGVSQLAGDEGITASVGCISGGGPVNVVPDRATCRFNIRVSDTVAQARAQRRLDELAREINGREGLGLEITGGFSAPPKPLDGPTELLLEHLADCGRELGLELTWRPTGGVCDGNRLAAAGLPTVDSLGVRGGNLHSPEEYMEIASLAERARLAALLLMKLASGEIHWPCDGRLR